MDRSALQTFNALGSATRRALWPSTIVFAGKPATDTWIVCMGPLTSARTPDPSGQAFIYYNQVTLEFPRDLVGQTFEPKVSAVFTRKADAICDVDTFWIVTKVQQIPNEIDLYVEAERAPR